MSDYPQDIIAAAGEICRGLDIKSTPTNCEPIIQGLLAERTRALSQLEEGKPAGHVAIAHDGFSGDIIGHYTTREGKRGVVVQQDGTRVVHVYGEKWLSALASPFPAPEAEPVAWRPEYGAEHIARDMRDGIFPARSPSRLVPSDEIVHGVYLDLAVGLIDHEKVRLTLSKHLALPSTPTPAVDADAVIEAAKIANALELCDWSGAPIGNKAILQAAVRSLRALSLPLSADKGE